MAPDSNVISLNEAGQEDPANRTPVSARIAPHFGCFSITIGLRQLL